MARKVSRWIFHQLYHAWAWSYDAVAAVVSLGRWYDWVGAARPFVAGPRVLEIGPGTGHLLEMMAADPGFRAFGLDESWQMLQLARGRVTGHMPLVRGMVERLPMQAAAFNTAVTTFPADFIRSASALSELHRILQPGGRLVILPAAQIVGRGLLERLMAWAMDVAGEAPRDSRALVTRLILPPLAGAGFQAELHQVELPASLTFVIVATRSSPPD